MFGRGFGRGCLILLLMPVAVFEVAEQGIVGEEVLISLTRRVRVQLLLLFILLLRVQAAYVEGLRVLLHLHFARYGRIGLLPVFLSLA